MVSGRLLTSPRAGLLLSAKGVFLVPAVSVLERIKAVFQHATAGTQTAKEEWSKYLPVCFKSLQVRTALICDTFMDITITVSIHRKLSP